MSRSKELRVNFRSKLWKVCSTDELRPALQCVFVKDGYFYATNGHVLIVQKCTVHDFTEEQIKPADGKMIGRDVMADLYKYNRIEFTESGIRAYIKWSQSYVLYPYYDGEDRFPDARKVMFINPEDMKPCNEFAINHRLFSEVCEAFVPNYSGGIQVKVNSDRRAIYLMPQSEPDQFALIMPVILNDFEHIDSFNQVLNSHKSLPQSFYSPKPEANA